MVITDAERRHLHDQAEQAMGEEAANTLMGYLPPVGWGEVATKTDLKMLEKMLETQIAQLRSEMAALQSALESKIDKSQASMVRMFFIGILGMASIPQIADRLFG